MENAYQKAKLIYFNSELNVPQEIKNDSIGIQIRRSIYSLSRRDKNRVFKTRIQGDKIKINRIV